MPAAYPYGGSPAYGETKPQFQEDVGQQPVVQRFELEIGHCWFFRQHVHGRHPLETSGALGAAQARLGQRALSLTAHWNKEIGTSHERAAQVVYLGYGLQLSRRVLSRAMMRLGEKAAPTYQLLQVSVRNVRVDWLDETGWGVAAKPK